MGGSTVALAPGIGSISRVTVYTSITLAFAYIVLATPTPDYGEVIRADNKPLEYGLKTKLNSRRRKLVLIHSAFGAIAWLFLAPTAIIIARFFKTARTGRGRVWFRLHFSIQSLTVIFMILTFVLGYYAVQPGSKYQFTNPHFQIGTAVFAAVLAQAVLGIFNHFVLRPIRLRRNSQNPLKTPFPNKIHIILGWLTLGLGISNIPIGMVLYGTRGRFVILFGVYVLGLLLVILTLEAVKGRDRGGIIEKDSSEERDRLRDRDRRRSSSTDSVLPVAGAEVQEVIYLPVEDEDEPPTRTERMHTAPEVPAMTDERAEIAQPTTEVSTAGQLTSEESAVRQTASQDANIGQSVPSGPVTGEPAVLEEKITEQPVLDETTTGQPTLKETNTGQPVEVPASQRPVGEVGEQAAIVSEPQATEASTTGPVRE